MCSLGANWLKVLQNIIGRRMDVANLMTAVSDGRPEFALGLLAGTRHGNVVVVSQQLLLENYHFPSTDIDRLDSRRIIYRKTVACPYLPRRINSQSTREANR
jgi:hypothetical protein